MKLKSGWVEKQSEDNGSEKQKGRWDGMGWNTWLQNRKYALGSFSRKKDHFRACELSSGSSKCTIYKRDLANENVPSKKVPVNSKQVCVCPNVSGTCHWKCNEICQKEISICLVDKVESVAIQDNRKMAACAEAKFGRCSNLPLKITANETLRCLKRCTVEWQCRITWFTK